MTDTQRRALEILKEHGPLRPARFGRLLWPDSPSWRKAGKCGPKGSSRGVGMRLASGGYLGKLEKKGWVEYLSWRDGYALSGFGRQALNEEVERGKQQ